MNAEFVHAADQFLAVADSNLDATLEVTRSLLNGNDAAKVSIDVSAGLKTWSQENLETVLTAALLRLARAE